VDMGGKEYSDRTAEIIDQEIKSIIDQAYAATEELVLANRDELQKLASALLKYETLSGEEARAVIGGASLDKPTVGNLLDREQAKAAKLEPGAAEGQTRLSSDPPSPTAVPQPG